MSSFTSLLLVVACAALLNAGCEARQRRNRQHARPSRRNSNDSSVILGSVGGSDIKELPVLQINGPDVILGIPDMCAPDGEILVGTLVIVSNNDGGLPPQLVPDDADDPESNVAISCAVDDDGSRCPAGISVASYQFCAPPLSTTPPPTTSTPSVTSSEN